MIGKQTRLQSDKDRCNDASCRNDVIDSGSYRGCLQSSITVCYIVRDEVGCWLHELAAMCEYV